MTSSAAADRIAAAPVTSAHFEQKICHNCGARLDHPFCPACGQKKAARLSLRSILVEAWERLRWFEFDSLRSAWRLATRPGIVAREYVLGTRAKHVHPLKLLLIAVGLLLILLGQNRYLESSNAEVGRAMAMVKAYADWSFSLGIPALILSSLAIFWRRLGYNFTEHLVLAIYCQFLIIAANIINQLPLLVLDAGTWAATHKVYSRYYMEVIETSIVALAYKQFFCVDWKRDSWRLALAVALYVGLKWALVQAYAWTVIQIVLGRLG